MKESEQFAILNLKQLQKHRVKKKKVRSKWQKQTKRDSKENKNKKNELKINAYGND